MANPNGSNPEIDWEEAKEKLRQAYMIGANDREACHYAGIGHSTLYKYQKEDPDFVEQKKLWRSNPVLIAKQNVFEVLKSKNDSKKLETSKWYIEKYDKETNEAQAGGGATLGAPQNEKEADLLLSLMNKHYDYRRRAKDSKGSTQDNS